VKFNVLIKKTDIKDSKYLAIYQYNICMIIVSARIGEILKWTTMNKISIKTTKKKKLEHQQTEK